MTNNVIDDKKKQQLRIKAKLLKLKENERDKYNLERIYENDKINKKTGAPFRVRSIIGNIQKKEDKLKALKKFYPDARPYGDDNFIFRDPESNKEMIVNPEGFDLGDIFGVSREISQFGLSTAGAVGGFFLGGLPGSAVGAGAGNVAGGQFSDWLNEQIADGKSVDTRTGGEKALNIGLDFSLGAAFQYGGHYAGILFKKLLRGGSKNAAELMQKFKDFSISPTAGQVTGNATIKNIESGLESIPGSANLMKKAAEDAIKQTKKAIINIQHKIPSMRVTATQAAEETVDQATGKTTQSLAGDNVIDLDDTALGQIVKEESKRSIETSKDTFSAAYENIFEEVGHIPIIKLDEVAKLHKSFIDELATAKRTLKGDYTAVLNEMKNISKDIKTGKLTYQGLRNIRTHIGRDFNNPVSGINSVITSKYKKLYGVLTEELTKIARDANPKIAKKLKKLDAEYSNFKEKELPVLKKYSEIKFDSDQKLWNAVLMSNSNNAGALKIMRKHYSPESWDTLVTNVIGRLGKATPANQNAEGTAFSVKVFLTRWNGGNRGLSKEAKDVLFDNTTYQGLRKSLDDLAKVIETLSDTTKLKNHSNTARSMITYNFISGIGGMLTGGGSTAMAAMGTVSSVLLTPNLAARLITNQRFVKWLATPITDTNPISTHLARLVGIAQVQPELKDAIAAYLQALKDPIQEVNDDDN